MRIGEAASETGLAVSNIRFYERKGLLLPAREQDSKYRDYSAEDIERLKKIMVLRKMDIPVETIYLLFNGDISGNTVLLRQEEELRQRMEALEGAMELCQKLQQEENLLDMDADMYLRFVDEEEKKGRSFAEIKDFVWELSEYTSIIANQLGLYSAAYSGRHRWVILGFIALYWLCMAGLIIYCLVTGKHGVMLISLLTMAACLVVNFIYFRRGKREE